LRPRFSHSIAADIPEPFLLVSFKQARFLHLLDDDPALIGCDFDKRQSSYIANHEKPLDRRFVSPVHDRQNFLRWNSRKIAGFLFLAFCFHDSSLESRMMILAFSRCNGQHLSEILPATSFRSQLIGLHYRCC